MENSENLTDIGRNNQKNVEGYITILIIWNVINSVYIYVTIEFYLNHREGAIDSRNLLNYIIPRTLIVINNKH